MSNPNALYDNIILNTDTYKVFHHKVYEPRTEVVYSYFESRGGEFPYTMFNGLQYILQRYLSGQVVTQDKIEYAAKRIGLHVGGVEHFNREGWEYIARVHNGRLPVLITAVPEGTVVPTHNVLMTIENTDPRCYWLPNYLETILVESWAPITVGTLSYAVKKMMLEFAEKNGDLAGVPFKLHCFGFRGCSSIESAAIANCAHLINFLGTDTMVGFEHAYNVYGKEMAGFSIPATEHSTITAWGRDREGVAFESYLDNFPTGIIACVSDSYDIYNACANLWGTQLHDKVMNRNGVLVIRPDSGDPVTVVLKCLEILGEKFGYSLNSKGYRILDPHVRLIQGDGVNYNSIREILTAMEEKRWSIDNIAFGMGGALLQKVNRDTQKFAFKCSAVKHNGVWRDVYKQPITDPGKDSKRGRLALVKNGENYTTVNADATTMDENGHRIPIKNELVEVFRNGDILKEYTFDEVRKNAWGG